MKIVTGDARPRATALARQIGMDVSDDQIIAASELSGPDVADVARRGRIFAGVVPADKYHLVQVLQHLGRHVAVTGDGVNDAPALQTADVGIALASGTDATKGAADLVLLDDNLEVIVEGIQQGRRTFTNINRYLLYTMVSNFANVIIVSIASFFLNFLPLLPSQVLLLNVLADLPMLAVVTDNVALEDLATPRRWDVRRIVELSIYLGIVNALFAFGLLEGARRSLTPGGADRMVSVSGLDCAVHPLRRPHPRLAVEQALAEPPGPGRSRSRFCRHGCAPQPARNPIAASFRNVELG